MNCREFLDFLMDYLERRLDDELLASFEQHVARCPPCLEYLKTYQLSIQLGRVACEHEAAELPAEVPDELVQAILAARRDAAGKRSDPAADEA